MLLHNSMTKLTRDELARSLALPRAAIDALATGGALPSEDPIALRDVERLLQDALLRLYHAEVANRAREYQRFASIGSSASLRAARRIDATSSSESP